jgi:hypothetical protein
MSSVEHEPWQWWLDWRVGGGLAAAVIGLVVLGFARLNTSSTAQTGRPDATAAVTEDELEAARESLAKDANLANCRSALQQINTHLSQPNVTKPPALPTEQGDYLSRQLDLKPADIGEISGVTYTLLDGHHLQYCMLLRDVARSFDVMGAGERPGKDKPVEPLDQVSAAFDWVTRQVRLQRNQAQLATTPQEPPDWVLRRGRGTPEDRALIFLGLLEQLNVAHGQPGAYVGGLVYCPRKGAKPRLWTGVAMAGLPGLYLFDPDLGMAIPGPGGKGVATLAQARQGDVLRQLDVPGGPAYDVTAEQAKASEIYLFCSLSALAPRQRHLQDHLLPPVVEVRLAADLEGDLARLKAAARDGAAKEQAVEVWKPGITIWRRFLAPDEGGSARPEPFPLAAVPGFTWPGDNSVRHLTPQVRFSMKLPPWEFYPAYLRNNRALAVDNILGQRLRNGFARPWEQAILDAGGPRDLLLRGQFTQAPLLLVQEREQRQMAVDRLSAVGNDLGQRLDEWVDKASAAHAEQLRARTGTAQDQERAAQLVAMVWKSEVAEPVYVLVGGALALARLPEVTFQLGLCKHEQAERLQAHVDRSSGRAPQTEIDKARNAWDDALGWWTRYATDYPQSPDVAAVRRLRGRAELARGDKDAALKSWQDVSGPFTDAEKIATLYRARQLAAALKK